jgi:DUF218 domain-containing protein
MSGGRVVAVVGYSRRRDVRLHPVCAGRVAHAQRLATGSRAVILSGEAEVMRAAWTGPDVKLVCDPKARSTAENALNVAAAARELGAEELVVVTSRWHRARVRILLAAALRGSAVRLRVESSSGPRSPLLLGRELVCLALLPVQLGRVLSGA